MTICYTCRAIPKLTCFTFEVISYRRDTFLTNTWDFSRKLLPLVAVLGGNCNVQVHFLVVSFPNCELVFDRARND